MKRMKIFLFGVLLSCFLLVPGCIYGSTCIAGSGNVISETRTVDVFHSVELQGFGDIYVTQGNESGLRIEAENNILPLMESHVSDGVLTITMYRKCIRNKKPVNIYVSMKDIKRFSITGQGDILSQSRITSEDLKLVITGQGDINLDVDADKLTTLISGQGVAVYKGTATSHDIQISGQGNIQAYELTAEKSTVKISGAGDVRVHTSQELYVTISGVGNVYYKGNPEKINRIISGVGEVKRGDSSEKKCGIENCHGLDITCGSNVPDACTEEYLIGDGCRRYARCEILNGRCQLVESEMFEKCKSCVEKCLKDFKDEGSKAFECESECITGEKTSENYCETDDDCACGLHVNTGECLYGNKKHVNTTRQCPDFCTGIAGNLEIKCIDNTCQQTTTTPTSSFEDCMKAGYPILESYPRQCKTPDGKTLTEKI